MLLTNGVGGGVASAPPKVVICWKSGQNHWKFWQDLWKSGQNPWRSRKTGAQRCFTSKNNAQRLQRNKWHFLGGDTKKCLHDLRGKQFVGKSPTTIFWASLGKFGQKSFAPPKNCLLLHLCC